MKELVIISGKGGTGKTSLAASFVALAENVVIADCDVDAADLHLILPTTNTEQTAFFGGKQAKIITGQCTSCGKCFELCEFDAIIREESSEGSLAASYRVDPVGCEGCGVCAWFCPAKAINFDPVQCGEWMISQTGHGTMVHARLGVAAENSGKLVSLVRAKAAEIAEQQSRDLIIIDGAPGVGCPVIASVTGVDMALVVTEPTESGLHDLKRILELLKHFDILSTVCINKYDINPGMANTIEAECDKVNIQVVGKISYSDDVIPAMVAGKTIVEHSTGPIVAEIEKTWAKINLMLDNEPRRN